MQPIRTVAAVISNSDGELLLVRKRGSSIFIQPGGKIEPHEDLLTTLSRELNEELGVHLDVPSAFHLGEFEAVAVNEPGRRVVANAFACSVSGTPTPRAEIEELAWVRAEGPYAVAVAPLSSLHILPAYVAAVRCASQSGG